MLQVGAMLPEAGAVRAVLELAATPVSEITLSGRPLQGGA